MRLWAQQSVIILCLLLCRDSDVADQMNRYMGKCGVMVPPNFDQVTATAWDVMMFATILLKGRFSNICNSRFVAVFMASSVLKKDTKMGST